MGSNDRIKRQIIRGVLQDNIAPVDPREVLRAKVRRYQAHKRSRQLLVAGILLASLLLPQRFDGGVDLSGLRLAMADTGAPAPPEPVPTEFAARPAGAARQVEVPAGSPAPGKMVIDAFPLGIRTIVIDPGHGGENLGAIAESGSMEKDITLDIALRLRSLLEQASFQVLLTRDTDRTVSLAERTRLANENGADLFVSIHVNSLPRQVRAIETYHLGPTDNPEAIKLAAVNNEDSGYSVSQLRELLDAVYLDAMREESAGFARVVHQRFLRSMRELTPDLGDRGVKMAPFVVLATAQMPAVLVEVSSLTNPEDAELLERPTYRQGIARALLEGIKSYTSQLPTRGRPNKERVNGSF